MKIAEQLSDKVVDIKPSGIRKFFDIVNEMEDAVSLGVGEPDFVTPWHIREEGIYSLKQGRTYYTSNWGLLELREEICNYMARKCGLHYRPENEVLVTVGGSEGIDLAIRALVNPGDEVLIPEPCFVCYEPCTKLAGGIPVPIVTKAEDKFKLTPQALEEKITPKTKLLILPYPNNPTGAIMTKEELEEIAAVLRKTNVMILSDEIYGELTYVGEHTSIASLDGMQERTVIINGFSKTYAMTGWRLGFAVGHKDLISQMTKIHQYAIMSSPTTSQYAAISALRNGDEDIERMREEYNYRRRVMVDGFRKMGLECFEPEGAFYVFPSIRSTGMDSETFCESLLKTQKVAVIPGTAFGQSGEGFIRASYCYSLKSINEALGRIAAYVEGLKA